MFRQKQFETIVSFSPSVHTAVAVEQFSSKDFFNNPAGWTRNDLAAAAAAASKSEFDSILQRLSENDPQFGLDDKVALKDAYSRIRPRYCQTPSEIQDFVEHVGNLDLDAAYSEYLKSNPAEPVASEPAAELVSTE